MSIEEVVTSIERLAEDRSVPNNVRELLFKVSESLENENDDLSVRINTATSLLDQASNDPNIAQHTRTKIWNLASQVETLKE